MPKKPSTSAYNRSRTFLEKVNTLTGMAVLNELNDTINPTIGMELENEIKNGHLSGYFSDGGFSNIGDWKYHSENSLRYNGFEYVSKPTRYKEVEDSVKKLFKELEQNGCPPEKHTNSIRTSFHVHFNQSSRTVYETMLFVALYYMFEPLLQDFCGKHRQNNLFCLRLEDTRSIIPQLTSLLEGEKTMNHLTLSSSDYRYGSVNFNSLLKFGTIEFRMMRASSDPLELLLWIDILQKIRRFAITCKSFEKLRQIVTDLPMSVLIENILGKELCETLEEYLHSYPTKEAAVRAGYCNVLPVIVAGHGFNKQELEEVYEQMKKWYEEAHAAAVAAAHTTWQTMGGTSNTALYTGGPF